MKNIFLGLICVLFFTSCNKQNKINDKFISKFDYLSNENPINQNDFYMFFVCIKNKKFTYLPNAFLFEIYQNEYKNSYTNYKFFLIDLYLNKICLEENFANFTEGYPINSQILDYDVEFLIDKFRLDQEKDNVILMEASKLDSETINNIAYNLFKKEYIISYDDYSGNLRATPCYTKSPDFEK